MTLDASEEWICHGCIDDTTLKQVVRSEGTMATCAYCEKRRNAIGLDELSDQIHEVIEEHFDLTSNYPEGVEATFASEFGWERSGEPVGSVIQDIAGIDEAIAEDVREHLSGRFGHIAVMDGQEDPYDDDACYLGKAPDQYSFVESWDVFRSQVRFRSRFFSPHAQRALNEIFGDLETMLTSDGKSVIRSIGPEDEERFVHRVRKAYSDEDLQQILRDPVGALGPPPSRKTSAGRMNASGVSVFYGAMDETTCIAEARAPVGSYVAIGRFEIIRPVRLLDFDALLDVYPEGSYFDSDYGVRWGRAAFLERLVREISRPVMPQDEEFDYLPTQAVSEYLASCVQPRLDGIIFRSSQTAGKGCNLVLFNHARRVEPYELPAGTKFDFLMGWQDEDDYDDSIAVFEEMPPTEEEPAASKESDPLAPLSGVTRLDEEYREQREEGDDDLEHQQATLRLAVDEIRILRIEAVRYKRRERRVSRHRNEKGEAEHF